jgi:hypothetical protein
MDYQGKYSEMMRNADEKIAKFRNVRRFSVDENDFVQSERFKFTRGLIELKKSNPSRIEDCMARDKTVNLYVETLTLLDEKASNL